jgi:hypothetical protein
MSHRIRPPKPEVVQASSNESLSVDEISKKAEDEQFKNEKNEKLLNELMMLKFRIKMCRDLYKVNMKGTTLLKKKLNSVYQKKLKKYCELNNGIFDTDLISQEINLEIDDLHDKLKKIAPPITGL